MNPEIMKVFNSTFSQYPSSWKRVIIKMVLCLINLQNSDHRSRRFQSILDQQLLLTVANTDHQSNVHVEKRYPSEEHQKIQPTHLIFQNILYVLRDYIYHQISIRSVAVIMVINFNIQGKSVLLNGVYSSEKQILKKNDQSPLFKLCTNRICVQYCSYYPPIQQLIFSCFSKF